MKRSLFLLLTASTGIANAQVVLYDGSVMPESDGWQREGSFDCDRWIDEGWFHQFCELGVWPPEPIGETDVYRKSLADFAGVQDFFIEWVVETDIPASILEVSGVATAVAAGGNGAARYHTTITDGGVSHYFGTVFQLNSSSNNGTSGNTNISAEYTVWMHFRSSFNFTTWLITTGFKKTNNPTVGHCSIAIDIRRYCKDFFKCIINHF